MICIGGKEPFKLMRITSFEVPAIGTHERSLSLYLFWGVRTPQNGFVVVLVVSLFVINPPAQETPSKTDAPICSTLSFI